MASSYRGAMWVTSETAPAVLLIRAELASGGRWRYTYSPEPGITITVVTEAGPGMPGPADSVMADIVHALTQGGP